MKHILTGFAIFASLIVTNAQVSIQIKVPPIVPGSEITLEIKIIKGAVTNFAKYQIDVPAGVYLSEGDNKTGSFSFENNRAKVIWVSIPTDPEFTITMKLNPGTAVGPGVISQKFYYLDNGTRKEVEAAPVTIDFSGGGTAVLSSANPDPSASVTSNENLINEPVTPVNTEPVSPNAATSPAMAEVQTGTKDNTITELSTNPTPVESPKTEPLSKESNAEAIRKLKERFDAANGGAEPPVEAAKAPAKTSTPATSFAAGVSFKIQIGAYEVNPGMSRYNALKGVNIIKEDNFYKVLVGNFNSREEAVKKKEELLGKGFKGFVVMYQNGARIK